MGYVVAVVGATGLVGREMLRVLEERDFPVDELRPLASKRSAGAKLTFRGEEVVVKELREEEFDGVDIALFSAGAGVSREFAPKAAGRGAVVIDNSSAFRMDDDVPLVVPEVNPEDVWQHRGIIANPNCSTIQMVVALKPLADRYGIKRVVVATYQSVSGWGKEAVSQLWDEIKLVFDSNCGPDAEKIDEILSSADVNRVLAHPIAFNILPHIDVFSDKDYTKEEWKMINETKKIMHLPDILVSPTCVRVPSLRAHSEAVNVELKSPFSSIEEVKELLGNAAGVEVIDDPQLAKYPLALSASGKNAVFVGRIRPDLTVKNGINMWVVADNLRKGAALNAVQIAEVLIKRLEK